MKIESDRFQNLSYDKPAFQTEAGAVYGEYRKDVTSPFMVLEEKLLDKAFDKHTYKHTTMGFEADVKAMPEGYDYSLSFFKRFYRPENVVILITGDVQPKAAFALIEKVLRRLEERLRAAEDHARAAAASRAVGRNQLSRQNAADPLHRLQGRGLRSRRQGLRRRAAASTNWPSARPANCTRNSCSAIRRSNSSWPTCR